ncbi:biopolymer transporter ExbB [Capsulimonas corticalis]|uniref:Biopolymer transporter ExbB n=1 Tax=Capsulimonas corticalis TaxID=2219043 RepID=A0A402D6U7_9BACT|nr:MotA/TolQ/ExbB proton channel family protein [Capsulimonas corticalis]BDI31808.1 biopolymer transporter ExbB [Capsulimonas corticalis]
MTQDVHFLLGGGVMMWPLFLCGIISVAVMIDRLLAIGATVGDNRRLVADVEKLVHSGRYAEALAECEAHPGRVAAMLASGLRAEGLDRLAIERHMEEFALRQMPVMMERLSVLDTIVTLAPLLGLLGTITGMIKAFHIVGSAATSSPGVITGGIAEALIATSAGLAIAIVTLPAYNFLTERVKENISEMEWRATQLMNTLAGRRA